MKLAMVGVDFNTADIDFREKVSLTQNGVKKAALSIKENIADGVVILSTCNRTEVYLATEEWMEEQELVDVFSGVTGIDASKLLGHCYIVRSNEMIQYLFELACGLHSMILGEDQIITQVNDAMTLATEAKAGNSVLNTIFRHAVTCAKKAKCDVNIKNISPSIVSNSMGMMESYLAEHPAAKVLVIGNGEIGRLAASSFAAKGCEVRMTLRTYKHTDVIVPDGVSTVAYDERQEMLGWAEIVVSATKSPHYTITREMLEQSDKKPEFIFDLALPRDIEPTAKELDGIRCFDVDDIGKSSEIRDEHAIAEIREIIDAQTTKFNDWYGYYKMSQREVVAG